MAEDFRKITLSQKEFMLALDSQRRAHPDFLPPGEITDYKVIPDAGLMITVRMVHGKNVNELLFNYKFIDIMPALLKFCMENNISLPETGKRFVKSEGEQMSLVIVAEV